MTLGEATQASRDNLTDRSPRVKKFLNFRGLLPLRSRGDRVRNDLKFQLNSPVSKKLSLQLFHEILSPGFRGDFLLHATSLRPKLFNHIINVPFAPFLSILATIGRGYIIAIPEPYYKHSHPCKME